jgi:iron complex outermembrane recepter protein
MILKAKFFVSVGLAALSAAAYVEPVQAQEAEVAVTAEEEITVTGIRASLESAIQVKRQASAIVDAISAEDMGKFPDQNLAESLQRITGVQISRSRGEGSNVSIRGLSPDFNQINFNGRTLPSATGGRSFDFTILSSELINSVEVYKSPTADIQEGGLAGTVNVRTIRPKDIKGRQFVVNAEVMYEQNADKVGPHVSALYTDRFMDDRLAIMIGGDYSRRKFQVDRYEAFGLESGVESTRGPVQDYNRDGDNNDTFLFNHAASFVVDFGTRTRTSLAGAIGFEASDNLDLWAEALYSKFHDDTKTALNAHRFTNISIPNAVRASTIGANGIVTVFDADGVDHRNNGRPYDAKDTLETYAAGADFTAGPFKLAVEGSYGRSQRVVTNVSLEVISRASVSQDLTVDPGGAAQVAYQRGYDPLNAANWRALGLNGQYKSPTTDGIWEARADASYEFSNSFLKSVEAGVYYNDRKRDFTNVSLVIGAQQLAPLLGLVYNPLIEGGSFAAGSFMTQYNFPGLLGAYGGSATFPTSFLSSNPALVFDRVSLNSLVGQFPTTVDLPSTYTINEKSIASYIKANFGSDDDTLRGNIGVRLVKTNQSSNGFAPDLSLITFNQQGAQTLVPGVTPVSVSNSYTKALPNFNMSLDVTPDLVVRFAAARVLSRPTLSVLSPSTSINANVRTITRGNPNVKPYTSDQLDLSVEWYFQQGGLLSGNIFYKKIKDFIVSTSSNVTLNVRQVQGGGTIPINFTVFEPNNGGNSVVKGFEVGYQQPLTFLPAPFDGFGVIANYTFVDADDLPFVAGGPSLPLPGVSKNNYNLVLYYEKGGFGARASYNYRDKFVVDSSSYFGDGQFTNSFAQLDLSANYAINKNLEVHIEALNVLDAATVNVNKFGINRGFEDFGRRVTGGVRLRF